MADIIVRAQAIRTPERDCALSKKLPIFRSYLQAGFECSTHRLKSGRRVDVVRASRHDEFARQDYQKLIDLDIRTAREGLRWHLIEQAPGKYDFASVYPFIEAAHMAGVEVIWDLMHFGWPDHLDIFSPYFIDAFRDYAVHAAGVVGGGRNQSAFIAPINEISFLSWAAGHVGVFYPFARFRGRELKKQLAKAAIAAIKAIRAEFPNVRFVAPEPGIHVVAHPDRPRDRSSASRFRLAMFEAWDMLSGRDNPELGGDESCLDIIGVNYYDRNQWFHRGQRILPGEPLYRPFADILKEISNRYERPMLIAETGAEDQSRVPWFRYVLNQAAEAVSAGVNLHGLCLYPIVNHPGWDDDRHCYNGLWDYADATGARSLYIPLALEVRQYQCDFEIHMTHVPSHNSNLVPDLVCFSHLRWNFVFQRPQHLMSRFARERRVFYVEEPLFEPIESAYWDERSCPTSGVRILVPHLPEADRQESNVVLRKLMDQLIESRQIRKPLLWFYTAMALEFLPEDLDASLVVYDCMDELSAFKNAPASLIENEDQLFVLADLVFTGGVSLFEAKRHRHPSVTPFPSGVDVAHFAQARNPQPEDEVQTNIPHPRIGFAGVIDERMDLALLAEVATLRPAWQFVMVGPVVKIDADTLPRSCSIHWLGMQDYANLPRLFAGWDVAIMPFAMNESTRFISPTKTPEYLAAGLPVVSTPIRDVVRPYELMGLARIASTAEEFVAAIEEALEGQSSATQMKADEFLEGCSWEDTWRRMKARIESVERAQAASPEDDTMRKAAYV